MYAIIRTGGKQAKVEEGDVLDIERVRHSGDELTFTPLLLVDGKGKVTSERDALSNATVTAKVLGPSSGPKVDIFKHKAKTGYRRSQGHRQKYTRIEVTKIDSGKATAKPKADAAKATAGTAKKATDDQPAAGKTPAKAAAAKTTGKETAAKKPAAKKPAAKKPAAKKPAANKEDA